MLAIDRDGRSSIVSNGGSKLLEGLSKFGPREMRAVAGEFATTLDGKQTVAVDAKAHAKQARATRVGQSKLRSSRVWAAEGEERTRT